ncbi:MAG: hypothetical protein Q9195_008195 [Heterodermia aff. obscurata]
MATEGQPAPSWLLLLTPSPSSSSFDTLKNAYQSALRESLQAVSAATKTSGKTQRMDIALGYSRTGLAKSDSRSSQYSDFHDLLGKMYKLLCMIYSQLAIGIELDNDVDARFILYDPTFDQGICIFNWETLAACRRPWKHTFFTSSDQGKRLRDIFLQSRERSQYSFVQGQDIKPVDTGVGASYSGQDQPNKSISMSDSSRRHFSVAVGGTFDHLHLGHKLLLTMTASVVEIDQRRPRKLTIGITGDTLLKKKQYAEYLQDWDQRQRHVRDFLLSILEPDTNSESTERNYNQETSARSVRDELHSGLIINYVEIFDPFGPTITDEEISALVISGETRSGGKAVNDRRAEKGWASLQIFEVDVLDAGEDKARGSTEIDFEDKISSTEIRRKLHRRHAPDAATMERQLRRSDSGSQAQT